MDTALPDGPRGQLLAAALTLTALAALWFGVAQPLIGWYRERNEELAQRRALLLHMQEAAATLPALQHASPAAEHPAPSALLAGATDALAAAAMQNAAQAMAATVGVELASLETLPPEARGAYRRIGLRVSLSAPWPALIALLRSARSGQPHMLIDDLQVRTATFQGRSAASPVTASFTLLAFRAGPSEGKP
jgi:general secretion pathway protein M